MSLDLELQQAVSGAGIPPPAAFQRWAEAALAGRREVAELVVRIVDEAESAQLNERFRGKAGPTNVLSFPFRAPPPVPSWGTTSDQDSWMGAAPAFLNVMVPLGS